MRFISEKCIHRMTHTVLVRVYHPMESRMQSPYWYWVIMSRGNQWKWRHMDTGRQILLRHISIFRRGGLLLLLLLLVVVVVVVVLLFFCFGVFFEGGGGWGREEGRGYCDHSWTFVRPVREQWKECHTTIIYCSRLSSRLNWTWMPH